MKKKETLKELLERLDAQSALYNSHLEKANDIFENAIRKVEWLLAHDRKDIHRTIRQIKKMMTVANRGRKGNKSGNAR